MTVVRLALPVRSPSPLSVPCTWRAPARTAAIELATAQPGVVVAVDADDHVVADVAVHVGDDAPRPRAAASRRWCRTARRGVAPLTTAASSARRRTRGCACSRRRSAPCRRARGGRAPSRNSTESAIIASPSSSVVCSASSHVVVPALGDDADRRGAGLDQVAQRGVVVDLALRPAGRAERDERAGRQLQLGRGAGEELDVLRVGARPAALDVAHAELGRAARRCAACPRRSPRRPRPGGRRAAWCRRSLPHPLVVHLVLTVLLLVMVSAVVVDDSPAAAAADPRKEEAAPEGGWKAHVDHTCATK